MTEQLLSDVCAAFQQAIVDVLVEKTSRAAEIHGIKTVVLGGGVSANGALRQQMNERCVQEGVELHLPSMQYCTDNGAMIAFAGYRQYLEGDVGGLNDDVFSRSHLGR